MPHQKMVHYTPFTAPEQLSLPRGKPGVLQIHVRFPIVSSHFFAGRPTPPNAMNPSGSIDHRVRADRGRAVADEVTYRNGRGANPDAFAR